MNLIGGRKTTRILLFHSLSENDFRPGEMVWVYVEGGHEKRERWLSLRQVNTIDANTV